MKVADNDTNTRAGFRWRRLCGCCIVAVIVGVGLWLLWPSHRQQAVPIDDLNHRVLVLNYEASSLLDRGDADPDCADVYYVGAYERIERVDSLRSLGATADVDTALRHRLEAALTAADIALNCKLQLFSDMPGYAADLKRRADNIHNILANK